MKTIYAHPKNIALLKRSILPQERVIEICRSMERAGLDFPLGDNFGPLDGIRLEESTFMAEKEPSGRYVLPDGRLIDSADELSMSGGRFVQYGPEDFDYLLWAGIIRAEMLMKFLLVDPDAIGLGMRSFAGWGPSLVRALETKPFVW